MNSRRRGPSSRLGDERGVAAVELAILMPILVTILFGITTFGSFMAQFATLANAAREGARAASVRRPDLIQARVTDAAAGFEIAPGTPAADIECTDATTGQPVTVSWLQHYTIQVPMLPDMSTDITMRGVFQCE